jgi:uncharacterized RmlC-like cupin family protein
MNSPATPNLMRDPYLEWLEREGVPVVEDFGVDLFAVDLKPWARFGVAGAAVNLKGRGDFISMFVLEIPPGRAISPQRHMYEEIVYVLSGRGSTAIEAADGRQHSFEWAAGSMFAIPLNARYTHFNASGVQGARMVSTVSLPAVINMFHNEEFIFKNPWNFKDRMGDDKYFLGEGDLLPNPGGRPVWETNFVPDLRSIKLTEWNERGAGSKNISFVLADSTMHAHISEMPVGAYKKAHRHPADYHVMCVTGQGYSLFWYEGDKDFVRIEWKHGTVFAPPDQMFHQHFNAAHVPVRYLATAFGSKRYPFTNAKRKMAGAVATSVKQGGDQIEYEDQSPLIARLFAEALDKAEVQVKMPQFDKAAS